MPPAPNYRGTPKIPTMFEVGLLSSVQ